MFIAVQTVGEEYIALLPLVSARQRKVPRFSRRLIFVFFFTVAPFLVEKILGRIKRNLENSLANGTLLFDKKQRNLRETLLSLVVAIRSSIQDHLFVFCLYKLSKISFI